MALTIKWAEHVSRLKIGVGVRAGRDAGEVSEARVKAIRPTSCSYSSPSTFPPTLFHPITSPPSSASSSPFPPSTVSGFSGGSRKKFATPKGCFVSNGYLVCVSLLYDFTANIFASTSD